MPAIVHVDKRLGDIAIRFPPEQPYCGEDFFPRKPVEHLSDFIARWAKGNILRLDDLAIEAPDDELPPEVELVLSSDERYQCRVYAVRSPDKVLTRKNADAALDYDVERALMVKQRLNTRLEFLRINQTLRNTAVMTNNATLTAAQRFDNAGSPANLPVTRGRAIVTALANRNGGNLPNVIRMTREVLTAIVTAEETKDFFKWWSGNSGSAAGGRAIADEDVVGALWGVPSGVVKTCNATYNLANAAAAVPLYRTFLGSDILFAYTAPPGLRTYGLGAEFRFAGYNTDPIAILRVPQFNRGAIPGEDIRGISICDPHVYNVDSGYLLRGCVDVTDPRYQDFLD